MITPKIFKLIIAGLLGFIVIILLFTCKGCKKPVAPVITPTKQIVNQVKDTEAVYLVKFDSINAANSMLKNTNASTLEKLHDAQSRVKYLASQLRNRPAGDTTIIEKGSDVGNGTINDFLVAAETADTLCNQAITNLQEQVANRETLITAKDSLYSRLRSSFDYTITQQDQLIKYNKDLQKQIRRKKFSNTFWKTTAAAAIIYGLLKSIK